MSLRFSPHGVLVRMALGALGAIALLGPASYAAYGEEGSTAAAAPVIISANSAAEVDSKSKDSDPLRELAQAVLGHSREQGTGNREQQNGGCAAQTQPAVAGPAVPVVPAAPIPSAPSQVALTGNPGAGGVRPSPQELQPLMAPPVAAKEDKPASVVTAANPGDQSWWLRTALALALVLVLIFVGRAVMARWSNRTGVGNSPLIEVLHRAPIAPKQHLMLIRLGGRLLLVGEGPNGLRTLANIRDPEEVAELLGNLSASKSSSASAGFQRLMNRFGAGDSEAPAEALGTDGQEYRIDAAREGLSGLSARLRAMGVKEGQR